MESCLAPNSWQHRWYILFVSCILIFEDRPTLKLLIKVQNQVVAHILANGGSDTQNSGYIFHFRTFQALMACRDAMRAPIPAAFHNSPGTIQAINLQYGHNIPVSVPMGEAWIILKTLILETDYREDVAFWWT